VALTYERKAGGADLNRQPAQLIKKEQQQPLENGPRPTPARLLPGAGATDHCLNRVVNAIAAKPNESEAIRQAGFDLFLERLRSLIFLTNK
jgi:hypothetical protein